MEKLFGKKVIGIDGFTEREGKIILLEENKVVGDMVWVYWNEEGNKEPFFPHQIKPVSEKCGIGVYYID
jgi:hypothetical protein